MHTTIATDYEAVIGLEVHAQLLTATKAFCRCSTQYGAAPNTNVCPVCLGHPGVLPVLNRQVVEMTLRMGLATNCSIRPRSRFARKNYFYPDLPKGYQISQYDDPVCYNGYVEIELDDGTSKRIGITRIHMEEDAGKSIHDLDIDTLVDLNRCGVPLIEIVSEPDIRSPREAVLYLQAIRQILMYLGICDGNMEEGSLRCDANVSVRRRGTTQFGTKTEVKNLNSFRNVEKALAYEIERHITVLTSGGQIEQETRMWDASAQVTRSMRTKEFAHDYRYFPEPDLVPVEVEPAWIERIRAELIELPLARKRRLQHQYGIPAYDAGVIVADRAVADYFEQCCAQLQNPTPDRYKLVSNWIMTDVLRVLGEQKISIGQFTIGPDRLADLVELQAAQTINSRIAKELFEEMLTSPAMPSALVRERGMVQVSDASVIEELVARALADNPDTIEKYQAGKTNVLGFLVGYVMKLSQGKANPQRVRERLLERLGSPDAVPR
jgi:aspartyl-tRNA(Asn)/glutamyl-tRNA(Gln) amidotransferase subunit B